MRVIISPAKKMTVDLDSLPPEGLPLFLERTERLLAALRGMTPGELQGLWRCNDALAKLNVERLEEMDLRGSLTPAVLAYEGIQYRYMAPNVFETEHLAYIREHLRIMSGFYGLLRPFDGVTPYRLEMQARLSVEGHKDLYGFWGDQLARQLALETDCILNLASKEYSRAVEPHLPGSVRFLTCTFGERKGEKIVEKGTMCKMARGQMVRWLAEHQITQPQDLKEFTDLGYCFSEKDSAEDNYVFLKGQADAAEVTEREKGR